MAEFGKAPANRTLNPFRPIETRADALHAMQSGQGIAIVLGLSYVLYIVFGLLSHRGLYGESAIDATFLITNSVAIALALALGVWVRLRGSLIGTLLLGLWFLYEIGAKLLIAPQTVNFMTIVYIAIAATCFILAIRGHLKMGKLARAPETNPQVFD